MNADIHILYKSSFYEIKDFRCKCIYCSTSEPEWQENFSIAYVRKGNFIFNIFRNSLDAYNGYFIINKPLHEQIISHYENRPDQCTIFSFNNSFYELLQDQYGDNENKFFKNNDIQSLLIKANAEIEYLHHTIIKAVKLKSFSRLLIDTLTTELVNKILSRINLHTTEIKPSLKQQHIKTIEAAKEFIHNNLDKNISLFQIADNCFVSPFYFSRIFRTFTGISPYKYLLETRLKNAEVLLRNTSLPVTQICYESGFNNPDHFSAAFKKKYSMQPSKFRIFK